MAAPAVALSRCPAGLVQEPAAEFIRDLRETFQPPSDPETRAAFGHLIGSFADPASPFARNNGERRGAVSHPQKARTIRQPLNKQEVAEFVADALRADFGRIAGKHKAIANAAGAASENTAKAWTAQQSLPGLEYFLELGKHSPAIQKMTMRLWNLDPDIDPEYQRAFMDLVRAVQSRGQR